MTVAEPWYNCNSNNVPCCDLGLWELAVMLLVFLSMGNVLRNIVEYVLCEDVISNLLVYGKLLVVYVDKYYNVLIYLM